jgi:hypothetical protein
MHRRHLLLALGAAAVPGAALAEIRSVPLSKAFGLLDAYLGLPPAERSRFYLAYRAMKDRQHPYPGAAATVVAAGGARFPVQFDAAGIVLRLPSLSDLKSGAMFESDAALRLFPEIRAQIALATRLDVGAIALALAQINAAIAKIAGPLALAAPKMTAAYFHGAGAGAALMADGRSTPLPVSNASVAGPTAYLEPAVLAGARTVVLARPPSRVVLGPHPSS